MIESTYSHVAMENEFHHILNEVIGLTEAQVGNINNQGIILANELMLADDMMITEVFTRLGLLNINSVVKL